MHNLTFKDSQINYNNTHNLCDITR